MRKIVDKIKNNSGETIGETLVALLISSLALMMLAGAIATSSGIITRSSEKIDSYYEANENLVTMTSAEGPVELTIKESGTTGFSQTIKVKYGKNEILNSSSPVVAFKMYQSTSTH